jgi:uncharacterized membrane protein YoaK (UPF0700 family)
VTPIVPLLCLAVFVYAIVQSTKKLRTAAYGLFAAALTLGAVYGLTVVLRLNEEIMAHVAVPVMFLMMAYVAWTHSRATRKAGLQSKPDA